METVVEWSTPARPVSRLGQMITFISLMMLGALATLCGVISILQGQGVASIVTWGLTAILIPTFSALLACNHLRGLSAWADGIPRTAGELDPITFSDSAFGGPITTWRDWSDEHRRGAGMLRLVSDGIEVVWRAPGGGLILSPAMVERIEVVAFRGKIVWSPQLRLRLGGGSQLVVAVVRSGFSGVFGLSLSMAKSMAVHLERHLNALG